MLQAQVDLQAQAHSKVANVTRDASGQLNWKYSLSHFQFNVFIGNWKGWLKKKVPEF